MKPVETPMPITQPPTRGASRVDAGKGDAEDQRFSEFLGQKGKISNEQQSSEQSLNGKSSVDRAVTGRLSNDDDNSGLASETNSQEDLTQMLFTSFALEGDKVTFVGDSGQQSAQENQGDPRFAIIQNDLTEGAQGLAGVAVQANAAEQTLNKISNGELGFDQVSRIKGQLKTAAMTVSGFPLNNSEAHSQRHAAQLNTATQEVQLTNSTISLTSSPVASDRSKALFAGAQLNHKSISMGNGSSAPSLVENNISGRADPSIPTGSLPSAVANILSERMSTDATQTIASRDVQVASQGQIESKENGGSALSSSPSIEISNATTSMSQSVVSEKSVWSQVADFLSSNLKGSGEKIFANTAPVFAPTPKSDVILKSLNLELQPGDLGTVKIELSLKNQKLTVELIADKVEAVDRLLASQEMIAQKMKSDGYLIDQFVIKNTDVVRPQDTDRFSGGFAAMEKNESEQSTSQENGASGSNESGRRNGGQQNIAANEQLSEADGRRDDEIYL